MKPINKSTASLFTTSTSNSKPPKRSVSRRSFLGTSLAVGAGTIGAGLLSNVTAATDRRGGLPRGDANILRFLAAIELIEADLWQQYNELGGIQDDEVPGGTGNPDYTAALQVLDDDMDQYIHDNTDDEITHAAFLNAFLDSKGADPVNLDQFRTLPSSQATGAQQIGRLTNLMQLTVDTSWWTRYRDDSHNPDLDPGFIFPQAVPTLGVNQHTAIPRTDADTSDANFLQAIANTAGFHFGFIEQAGTSLYPSLAQRVNRNQTLRILLSLGPTEAMHFQTWHDKAGDAPPLTAVDPVTGVSVTFPDLEDAGELFQSNLIMPEPTIFLNRSFPIVSIVRPTETDGAATAALDGLTADGLFIGQSQAFFDLLSQLARRADHVRHGGRGRGRGR
jgi:hypothetical protein